jgi:HlyD family secretion protein
MTASVEIETDKKADILVVPIQAVTLRGDTSSASLSARERRKKSQEGEIDSDEEFEVVFIAENGQAQLRVVETGIQDDKNIQILNGIKEGEAVIKGPYSAVSKTLNAGEDVSVEGEETKKRRNRKEKDESEEESSED